MDIRVGKIVKVWKHPDSEKLWCEEIDIGNGEIRQIASGLQQVIPIEGMQDKIVIVLTNLKAKPLGGFPSHGMVLCAETPDRSVIELITPPEGSVPGDLVFFEGQGREPPAQLPKKNPWDTVQPKLKVDENGVCCWTEVPFKTSKGVCTAKTIRNGVIH
jgi:methionine--tRNA ligase beta chain